MGNSYLGPKSKEKIGIVDVNNFYVSAERLFNPSLDETPTVVLSNNDGCIIARSQEVKDMGIKMGQPLFELEDSKKKNIKKFSSNYSLYGDISDRIITILKRMVPKVEVYSIDEAFIDLTHISDEDLISEITKIKSEIKTKLGIPVSIGVGPNKTLAKLCNRISKTDKSFNGVTSYFHIDKSKILNLDIDEVWGIGRKWNKKLNTIGVSTVGEFMNLLPTQVKGMMHVTGLRTWSELHEGLCHPIKLDFKKPKMITCSRTFGSTVWERGQIVNAMVTFLETCHKKLIREKLICGKINLFATTNRFDDNYYVWSIPIILNEKTDDFQSLWNQVSYYLDYMPIRLWYKAGVNLTDMHPNNVKQKTVLHKEFKNSEIPKVTEQKWVTRRDFLSPAYTTNWEQIPLAF